MGIFHGAKHRCSTNGTCCAWPKHKAQSAAIKHVSVQPYSELAHTRPRSNTIDRFDMVMAITKTVQYRRWGTHRALCFTLDTRLRHWCTWHCGRRRYALIRQQLAWWVIIFHVWLGKTGNFAGDTATCDSTLSLVTPRRTPSHCRVSNVGSVTGLQWDLHSAIVTITGDSGV
jgi:hypothetical protein